MARWIVVLVVAALVLPLVACKRNKSGSQAYDPKTDPPASLLNVTIDPNIKEKQEPFHNLSSAAPVTPAPRTDVPPPVKPVVADPAVEETPVEESTGKTPPPAKKNVVEDDPSKGIMIPDVDTPPAPEDEDENEE